ncbi:MAG: DUF3786 domain-containing protein [Candidatus Electrothrix communis]|nr:MAG: DUF3786 domain-containing protein [Candidatus Electrothrix communis]
MAALNTPLEVYKLLNKSNCRKCMLPSCLAFAAAVIQGQKKLSDCPELDTRSISGEPAQRKNLEDGFQEKLHNLQQEAAKVDYARIAEKLGGKIQGDSLAVNCLGKDFIIDPSGAMTSECHRNQWVHLPLLSYIVHGQGRAISGERLPFDQLQGAADWSRFFSHRCEEDMRKLIDSHTELFFELMQLFDAQPVSGSDADRCLLIHPMPKLPMIIHYWNADDDFASQLSIFFDCTAPDNINIEYIYTVTRGIVEMFRELIVKHNMTGRLF